MTAIDALVVAAVLVVAHVSLSYLTGRAAALRIGGRLPSGMQVAIALLAGGTLLGGGLIVLGLAHLPWNLPAMLALVLFTCAATRRSLLAAATLDLDAARNAWRELTRSPLSLVLAVAIVVVLLGFFAALTLRPVEGNDGVANFLFKAKVFWLQQRADLGPFVNDAGRHPDYPVGLPLALDTIYAISGGLSEHLGRVAYLTYALALALGGHAAFRRVASPVWSLSLTALLVAMPIFAPALVLADEMGYADFPLACALFLSAATLSYGTAGTWAAVAAALVAATLKLEGEVWMLGLGLLLLVVARRYRYRREDVALLGRGGIGWLAALTALALWWPLVSTIAGAHSRFSSGALAINANGDLLQRARLTLTFAVGTIGIRYDTGWLALAAVLAVQLAVFSSSRRLRLVAALVTWQVVVYAVTYLLTTDGLLYLLSTTIYRLYMHVAPLVLLCLVLALEPHGTLQSALGVVPRRQARAL